ncbi:MAG: lipoyl(octanoyl) transferase LipB [Thermodesulfobacteriota bacterium]
MTEIKKIGYQNLGFLPYYKSVYIQDKLQDLLLREETDFHGFLLFLYHEPIITIGKYSDYTNLLVNHEKLSRLGVEFYHSDRGGDITCHEPGQIVIYPIFNLKKFNLKLKEFVSLLENVVIDLLNQFNIHSERREGKPGVWIGKEKIASLGISVKRHCTKHGIAINVNNSLKNFEFINPCGYQDIGITSVKKQLKREININECADNLLNLFSNIFVASTEEIEIRDFLYEIPDQLSSSA